MTALAGALALTPVCVGRCSRMCCVLANGFSFFFCTNKRKTKQKENSPAAFFCLLRHFSTLNKKNSLRSNSFLFLTLRKAPPLHGKKRGRNLQEWMYLKHRFARCSLCIPLAKGGRGMFHRTCDAMRTKHPPSPLRKGEIKVSTSILSPITFHKTEE